MTLLERTIWATVGACWGWGWRGTTVRWGLFPEPHLMHLAIGIIGLIGAMYYLFMLPDLLLKQEKQ